MQPKFLLIGLDGGTPSLITKWLNELPTFQRLITDGWRGEIESTVPATTIPAWNSIYSGKNPGKLGIYDFLITPHYRPKGLEPANYTIAPTKYLWDLLSASSITSEFINVPIMFPPPKLQGVAVSGGIFVPIHRGSLITYPESVKEELDLVTGGYEASPFMDLSLEGKESIYLSKALLNLRKQGDAVNYLISRYKWDFFSYVFSITDTIQHYFWHQSDSEHTWHRRPKSAIWSDSIKKVYMEVDRQLGRILNAVPKDVNVMIVSDHGGGPLTGHFFVNRWLRDEGYLEANVNGREFLTGKLLIRIKNLSVDRLPRVSERLAPLLPLRLTSRLFGRGLMRDSYSKALAAIDWPRTVAYGLGSQGAIYINLLGREPHGIVGASGYDSLRNAIISKLRSLRSPVNGEPLSVKVWTSEDLYNGDYLRFAPDINFVIQDNQFVQKVDVTPGAVWGEPDVSGGHSSRGFFCVAGPDFKKSQTDLLVTVCDILPTVLHELGLPIPSDLDGRVLAELFEENSSASRRGPIYRDATRTDFHQSQLTEEDEEEIKKRLESLGYM